MSHLQRKAIWPYAGYGSRKESSSTSWASKAAEYSSVSKQNRYTKKTSKTEGGFHVN